MSEPTLRVTSLSISSASRAEPLVDAVSFEVGAGERVGLIGESGSGKSLTALSIMGLLPDGLQAHGSIRLAGVSEDLVGLPERRSITLRGRETAMVFQEPMTALNPVMRIGDQVAEVLTLHQSSPTGGATTAPVNVRQATIALLAQVRLPDPAELYRAYPHQLSGGMRQRVVLAMALANRPRLLICDEPTSALDVTVQAAMLDLIVTLQHDQGSALLFITHDLAVVAQVCDRVLVLQNGVLLESGPTAKVFADPQHPYTRALVAASDPTSASRKSSRSAEGRRPAHDDDHAKTVPVAAAETAPGREPILRAQELHRTFRRPRRSLRRPGEEVRAVRGVDLEVPAGEKLGIVGESGSGKSSLVRLLAGLDRPDAGRIWLDGREVTGRRESALGFLRRDLQIVFQDPRGSLDPRMLVRDIVAEPMISLRVAVEGGLDRRVAELLESVGLPAGAATRYPHQFSGGQRQRISIARALSVRPRVLIADEPVSALDTTVRAQILALLEDLVSDIGLTLIFVSHDLSVVRALCDRVAVLYAGEIVEQGPTDEVYRRPRHDYTHTLLAAVPTLTLTATGQPRSDHESTPSIAIEERPT